MGRKRLTLLNCVFLILTVPKHKSIHLNTPRSILYCGYRYLFSLIHARRVFPLAFVLASVRRSDIHKSRPRLASITSARHLACSPLHPLARLSGRNRNPFPLLYLYIIPPAMSQDMSSPPSASLADSDARPASAGSSTTAFVIYSPDNLKDKLDPNAENKTTPRPKRRRTRYANITSPRPRKWPCQLATMDAFSLIRMHNIPDPTSTNSHPHYQPRGSENIRRRIRPQPKARQTVTFGNCQESRLGRKRNSSTWHVLIRLSMRVLQYLTTADMVPKPQTGFA